MDALVGWGVGGRVYECVCVCVKGYDENSDKCYLCLFTVLYINHIMCMTLFYF